MVTEELKREIVEETKGWSFPGKRMELGKESELNMTHTMTTMEEYLNI